MLFNLLRAADEPGEQKASAIGGLVAFHGGGRAVWTARDGASMTRAGYVGNAVGFRCVRMIAEASAAVPFLLSENGRMLAEHPVLGLLKTPNAGQDGAGLLEALYGHLQLSGDAYVEAAGLDDASAPDELQSATVGPLQVEISWNSQAASALSWVSR